MKTWSEQFKNLQPEVDYQALMAQMPDESHPRRRLKELQTKGYLTRVKKGFYVLSKDIVGRAHSPQIVANLLYGPSYLSLEYALSHYGLIPERVEAYTSVTTQKNKSFQTPIGRFTYSHLTSTLYPLGVRLAVTDDGRSFLIASVEKALMDIFTLRFDNKTGPKKQDVESALTDDLRIELSDLKRQLNRDLLLEMKPHYKYRKWNHLLIDFLL